MANKDKDKGKQNESGEKDQPLKYKNFPNAPVTLPDVTRRTIHKILTEPKKK